MVSVNMSVNMIHLGKLKSKYHIAHHSHHTIYIQCTQQFSPHIPMYKPHIVHQIYTTHHPYTLNHISLTIHTNHNSQYIHTTHNI